MGKGERGGGGGVEPVHEKIGTRRGSAPSRFSADDIASSAREKFGKVFILVIF